MPGSSSLLTLHVPRVRNELVRKLLTKPDCQKMPVCLNPTALQMHVCLERFLAHASAWLLEAGPVCQRLQGPKSLQAITLSFRWSQGRDPGSSKRPSQLAPRLWESQKGLRPMAWWRALKPALASSCWCFQNSWKGILKNGGLF